MCVYVSVCLLLASREGLLPLSFSRRSHDGRMLPLKDGGTRLISLSLTSSPSSPPSSRLPLARDPCCSCFSLSLRLLIAWLPEREKGTQRELESGAQAAPKAEKEGEREG